MRALEVIGNPCLDKVWITFVVTASFICLITSAFNGQDTVCMLPLFGGSSRATGVELHVPVVMTVLS